MNLRIKIFSSKPNQKFILLQEYSDRKQIKDFQIISEIL